MFNVQRSIPEPLSLALQTSYKGQDVIDALRAIFHDKCYLCEQDSISSPEVEHFVPHNKTAALKFGWNNLFYSCRRCNSIKSNTHTNLLDGSNSQLDVFSEIIHYAGNAAMGEVVIKASSANPSPETVNSVNLISKCFNDENTSLRGISKESLLEILLEDYTKFLIHRNVLAYRGSTQREIQAAKEKLSVMCQVQHRFSVFWKWHIINDVTVNRKFPAIRVELDF
ncbi:hypothetical protein [Hafnia alvei]|uniref:hypothetical protein n=1 Tax=Hafnia alvei TaxID=569 RepID=UPI00061D0BDD|nr:hypothetical protein [Hafnia alvei]KKF38953.1 hypothetical protein PU01_20690 [Hafnia alvei]MBW3474436.1 hypothetical protein [Hafnia alvei]